MHINTSYCIVNFVRMPFSSCSMAESEPRQIAWNGLIPVGPKSDPAKVSGMKDIGGGMGAALNAAAAMDAYTLSDRGTWLSFNNRQNLVIVVEGDRRLLNYYDVIQLDPKKHPNIKRAQAKQLADWLSSKEGQAAIAGYTVGGEKLFHPEADPKP